MQGPARNLRYLIAQISSGADISDDVAPGVGFEPTT